MDSDAAKSFRNKILLLTVVAVAGLGSVLYMEGDKGSGRKTKAKAEPDVQTWSGSKLPIISDVTVKSSADDKTVDASLPFRKIGDNREKLEFNFKIMYETGQPTIFHITPDDCIVAMEINDVKPKLTKEAATHHCDWAHGFMADLKDYLHAGVNTVHARVVNRGNHNPTGLKFVPVDAPPPAAAGTSGQ